MSLFLAYPFNKAIFLDPQPTTQLERDVDALLKAAKMRDEDIPETEDPILKRNDPSVEQIAQRRNELRKMRELMFRAEIKSRRVKKIKSKTYRRLRRKEKEHLDEKINGNTAEEGSETESRLKREMERAKERATLKHKHTGKWAKQMRNREDLDDGTRRDIEDMLARGDRLRRRIQGIASGESEGENGDDDDDDDDELEGAQGIAKIKQDAFSELAQLESKVTMQSKGKAGTSVFDMKFMKEAMARKASVANKEVDDFIKEMGGDVGHVSDEAGNEFEEEPRSGVVAVRSGGRVVYRPASTVCIFFKKIILSLLIRSRRPVIYPKPTRLLHQTLQASPSNQRISFHLHLHPQSITAYLLPHLSERQIPGSSGMKSCCQKASKPRTASLSAKRAKRLTRPDIG